MAGGLCCFKVLGPLSLERDGRAVALPSGRQRSLLALLLMAGGVPLSRDRLIDELWGEHPPASAVSALHVHLSKLRGLLAGLLILDTAGYSLSPDAFELDVWRFDALVEQARIEPERAPILLREALGLFRGDPLCDVASEGSVSQWRRALEEKRLQALMSRVDADLAAGAAGELLAELEPIVREHPFEERLWGQLMLALYRAGRQAEALEAFQRARMLFASELGLEPGEPMTRLQQRILERDPGADAAAGTATAPAPAETGATPDVPHRSNLPRPLRRLVGRERELAALAGLMADPDVRIVTLTGPGGVGKTRLLLELARIQEAEYGDGAVFVRLERLTDPALVASEIASSLALRDGTDGPSADGLVAHLRGLELLMVVDNFEHLLAAAVLLAELLALAPRLRVLVSSRTPLRIRGEQVFEVEPLELPTGEDEDEVSRSPAVQLFLECALAANRRLEVDGPTIRIVADICRALDGLPLALELAASRSTSLTPAQIADQLARPLQIGEHALRDLPDRQQTLQATISWSYDLLSAPARNALRASAAFLGGFTLPALEAVVGEPVGTQLDELLESSLVRRQNRDGRYELRELIRAFALDALATSEQASEARARHRHYFADLVAHASEGFDIGTAPGEIAAPLLPDHANLRAAVESAIEAGDQDAAVALALGLRPVWLAGMLRQESQELIDRVLERFSPPSDKEIALLRAGAFLDSNPNLKGWNRRLASRAAEVGDLEALATATGNLFGQAINARDRVEMKRLRPELLALITPDTSARALGWLHYFLSLDAYVDGQFDLACEHADLSAVKAREIGHEFMLASAAGTRVMSQYARDGTVGHEQIVDTVELMRRPGLQPLSAFALWVVARYAAAIDVGVAVRALVHAQRILASLDAQLWPESELRDGAIALAGVEDLDVLLDTIPPMDHVAALSEACAWLQAHESPEAKPAADLVPEGEATPPDARPARARRAVG